jgi:hypothetical protein
MDKKMVVVKVGRMVGSVCTIPFRAADCVGLVAVRATFTTTATVGFRNTFLRVRDGDGVIVGEYQSMDLEASQVGSFNWSTTYGSHTVASLRWMMPIPLPGLMPGWQVSLEDSAAIDALDVWSDVSMIVCLGGPLAR